MNKSMYMRQNNFSNNYGGACLLEFGLRFTFYKPNDIWKVNGITYRDDLDFLFE